MPGHAPTREPTPPDDQHILIAIVVLLMAALTSAELVRRLSILLAPLGIPPLAVLTLVALLEREGGLTFPAPTQTPGPGQATVTMQRGLIGRRAMYILAAARRLAEGGTLDAERRIYAAHQAAERRRTEAARQIDETAAAHGPILGWWSHKDSRTTPACRAAHGTNFSALAPPAMGWPGTLHGGQCRCRAVAPWTQAQTLGPDPAQDRDVLLTPLER